MLRRRERKLLKQLDRGVARGSTGLHNIIARGILAKSEVGRDARNSAGENSLRSSGLRRR